MNGVPYLSAPAHPSNTEAVKNRIYYNARHGMAVALSEQLSEMKEANVVRQIISELVPDEGQECTPLIIAARHGHERIVRMLLKYNPDLEQEATVKFDGYPIEGATALWCAAGGGHLGVVKILVRTKAIVNHTTKTNSTPVRAACFEGRLDIVKYLTEHQADIHITNKYNNTCLMIAAYKGHLDVVNYLLELGANPNEKAHCGATALHFAAECGHVKIVKSLLENGGVVISNEHGMTPLLAAAERACAPVVSYLIARDECSISDKVDALELLGASYASDKDHYNLEIAYEYLERAMTTRFADQNNPIVKVAAIPQAPYSHHEESETMEQLKAIRYLVDSLHMEALVIRERILGPNNPEVPAAVIFRGAVFADHARFDRCLELWIHALDLKITNDLCVCKDLLRFAQVFSQMIHVGEELQFDILLKVLDSTSTELKRNQAKIANPGPKDDVQAIKVEMGQNMTTALYLVVIGHSICKSPSAIFSQSSYGSHPVRFEDSLAERDALVVRALLTVEEKTGNVQRDARLIEQEERLMYSIYKLIESQPLTERQESLLHLAVNQNTHVDDFHTNLICKFPCANTVKTLLMCGADPNLRDRAGNSPLHYIAPYRKPISDFLTLHSIINNLLKYGAHVDIVNNNGFTPFKTVQSGVADVILRSHSIGSLQCLCARTIVRTDIQYKGRVHKVLEPFIELHAPSGTYKNPMELPVPL